MLRKISLVLISLALLGCKDYTLKDVIENINLSEDLPKTSSVNPQDTHTQYANTAAVAKAKTYLNSMGRHYDQYGLLLPTKDGSFNHKGDALGWNMIALQTMCMLTSAYDRGTLDSDFNLQPEITNLWTAIKTHLVLDSGAIIRHPDTTRETSISKDHMSMFISPLGFIKHLGYNLEDADQIISKFIEYGKANKWEMGLPGKQDISTTYLSSRHPLYELAQLYNLPYSQSDLSLATSGEITEINVNTADYINENRYKCNFGITSACLKILDSGVYGNHITHVSTLLFYIGALHNQTPTYTLPQATYFLKTMAKVGQGIGYPNWLFVAAYRHLVLGSTATYNDITKHLTEDWPNDLPNEITPVTGWGCNDFVWQRVPVETCNQSDQEYLGIDYLLLFAYTVL